MIARALTVSFFLLASQIVARAGVITFEEKNTYTATGISGSYYNGKPVGDGDSSLGWTSGGVHFSNSYNGTYSSWSGFSYSNVVNTTTAGFGNQYAAFPGSGSNSSQYAVAFNFSPGDAVVRFATPVIVNRADFANTTYAAISMRDGDPFAKKFGGNTGNDPDFFRLDVLGFLGTTNTGTSSLFLADFRSSNNSLDYILNGWLTQNLTSLGIVDSLQFNLESSDNGAFGINTPTYFALDNLNITAVPEPSSVALLSVAVIASAYYLRKKQSGVI